MPTFAQVQKDMKIDAMISGVGVCIEVKGLAFRDREKICDIVIDMLSQIRKVLIKGSPYDNDPRDDQVWQNVLGKESEANE